MRNFLGAPAEGVEWTVEDVWNLKPGEYPPWNPDGIVLHPSNFPTVEAYWDEVNRMVDESGYRELYDAYRKGPPGSAKRAGYDLHRKRINMRNLLIAGGAIVAAFFAFGGG